MARFFKKYIPHVCPFGRSGCSSPSTKVAPRLDLFTAVNIYRYEAITADTIQNCNYHKKRAIPIWFLYIPPVVRLLQVRNSAFLRMVKNG